MIAPYPPLRNRYLKPICIYFHVAMFFLVVLFLTGCKKENGAATPPLIFLADQNSITGDTLAMVGDPLNFFVNATAGE